METLPSYTTHSCMTLDQNFQSDNERPVGSLAMASEPSAVSNKQGTTQESVMNSTDRKDNSVCVKCPQARSEGNLCADDAVCDSTESFKPLTCRRIDNFLEKNKDYNYYEEFMLPDKVLSKFALVLGKYVLLSMVSGGDAFYLFFFKWAIPCLILNTIIVKPFLR